MNYENLANLLFPHIDKTPEDYEAMYPPRNLPEGAPVTRLGPSPTGFIHLGNLYGAFVDERVAHLQDGIFYLRIEDTDDKRFVEGAAETVIRSLEYFGIAFDEGATKQSDELVNSENNEAGRSSDSTFLDALKAAEIGDYGPYHQSMRKDIYQTFVKKLVAEGKAYPCFLTETEIAAIRENQEKEKKTPGIYGDYASCRNLTEEEIEKRIAEGQPYVIRLRSSGLPEQTENTITVADAIRGDLTMPANFQDVVILKTSGLPTYHFAHVVDDHLMRTTHVVRGEEWLSSLPVHYELFHALGWVLPTYCHTAVLMKLDNGNKRKLSKRKDPELSLDYYRELGYHPAAVREYLLTILNSDFEEWRTDNPDADYESFPFRLDKMGISGALFDLDKLNDVSKDVLVKIPAADLYEYLVAWAKEFKPEVLPLLTEDPAHIQRILDIGRTGDKPRKDLQSASQIFEFIKYFFDDHFVMEDELPEQVSKEDAVKILEGYLATYDHKDDQPAWFDKIRTLSTELGYAAKPKDYKKNPEEYKGHVGHVSGVIRLAIVGRSNSPDVWEIQQILGEERTRSRIEKMRQILA